MAHDVAAEDEALTLTEISHRLQRTPGSTKDYLSWLEDVDLNGTRTMHGPATPAIGGTIPGSRCASMLFPALASFCRLTVLQSSPVP